MCFEEVAGKTLSCVEMFEGSLVGVVLTMLQQLPGSLANLYIACFCEVCLPGILERRMCSFSWACPPRTEHRAPVTHLRCFAGAWHSFSCSPSCFACALPVLCLQPDECLQREEGPEDQRFSVGIRITKCTLTQRKNSGNCIT